MAALVQTTLNKINVICDGGQAEKRLHMYAGTHFEVNDKSKCEEASTS